MFKRNKKLIVLIAVLILVLSLVVGCATKEGTSPGTSPKPTRTNFVFGSSVDGSYGYLVLEAMSSVLNKHFTDIRFSSVSTDGGSENIFLLFNNDIDAGHSNNADILNAYMSEGPFKDKKYEPMQLLSYGALTQIVAVRADSDIKTIYDLKGKKVIVGPPGSGLETDTTRYFGFADIDIVPVNLAIPETADAFISGRADAALLLFRNGQPYPLNMEVEAAMEIRYLPWDPKINKMMMDATAATPGIISPDVSPFMNEPMEVYMNPMILLVRPDLEEELAYSITKTLVENVEELKAITPHLQMVAPENVTKGLVAKFPVHPGAVRYYKETGIWEDRLTAGK
ncbi:MAG: TAXI family TRAP transporter solute-binding subunit [Bacillota bacterium]|nr:TAXI family TRAP transporter solute-binding subunit [Bacillota bacterium]